jgi:ribonucleoside-diphosphate reductase alpha chain
MFVNVMEDDSGEPFQIIINIGKAGSAIAAWANAASAMLTVGLRSGVPIETFLTELSSITSSGSARSVNSVCTSGPEGLWMALIRYRRRKFQELEEKLEDEGLLDTEDEDAPSQASVSRL